MPERFKVSHRYSWHMLQATLCQKNLTSKWRLKIQGLFEPSVAVCTDMYCVFRHLHLSLPPSIAYVKNRYKMII